jgi:hypothetical protein
MCSNIKSKGDKDHCRDGLPQNMGESMPEVLTIDQNLRRCGISRSYIRFSEEEMRKVRERRRKWLPK